MLSWSLVGLKNKIVVLGPILALALKYKSLASRVKFLALALKAKPLAFVLRLKSLVLTLICCGAPDSIDWSYILPDDGGRVIHMALVLGCP